MKLYVANGTKQIQTFMYRLPGNWEHRIELTIPQGMQVKLPGDLLPEEVESIVMQHARYGFIKASEIDRNKPYAGLCYSIDTPVTPQKIEKLFNHNKTVLEQKTEENLMTTALANNKMLEDTIEQTAREAHMPLPVIGDQKISIAEIPRHGSPQKTAFFRNGKDAAGEVRIRRS